MMQMVLRRRMRIQQPLTLCGRSAEDQGTAEFFHQLVGASRVILFHEVLRSSGDVNWHRLHLFPVLLGNLFLPLIHFLYIPESKLDGSLEFFAVIIAEDDAVVGQLVVLKDFFQLSATV